MEKDMNLTDVKDHAAKVSMEEQMRITTIHTLEKAVDHDVKDHAAKVSVEEQMRITTIQNLEKDLDHDVKDHTAKVSVEEQMRITTIQNLENDLDHGIKKDDKTHSKAYLLLDDDEIEGKAMRSLFTEENTLPPPITSFDQILGIVEEAETGGASGDMFGMGCWG